MRVVLSDDHAAHVPTGELYLGELVRPFECPERWEHVVAALDAAGLEDRTPPDPLDLVGVEAEFRKDVPAKSQIEPWLRFCDALTNSPVASLSLDLTGLGHPATVDPLACALEVMENVSKCYVHDNPIQQNELYWLESKGNGGTHSHKLPFYELFSGHS